MLSTTRAFASLFSPSILAAAASADVLVVAADGIGADHATIQAAIDAAAEGDLVLVREGAYAGFTLDGVAVSVMADVGAAVAVEGTVHVRNLVGETELLLSGLLGKGEPQAAGLVVADCASPIRLERCSFEGGIGEEYCFPEPGGPGARVTSSASVSFVGCTLFGGSGGGTGVPGVCYGGDGGAGLEAIDSPVAVYESVLRAGDGGWADQYNGKSGGRGGDGCRVAGLGAYLAGCTARGGDGGLGYHGGDGGLGIFVAPPAGARVVDCTLAGGAPGEGEPGDDGSSGRAWGGGGLFLMHPGTARAASAPPLAAAATTLDVEVHGELGDALWGFVAAESARSYAPELFNFWFVPRPSVLTRAPSAEIGPSGRATISVKLPALAQGATHEMLHVQVLVRTATGEVRLSNPVAVAALACAGPGADCDGDGRIDTCELLDGSSPDVDGNSVPDECDPDCNGNGVPDGADVQNGTSADANSNGVPDECEPTHATWYVDSSAAPGGDGSPSAPFRTLAQAFGASLDRHEIRVAGGTYTGPENKRIDFAGRDIAVIGAGSDSCVIDLEGDGRAFVLRSGETSSARIEGLRIQNGSIDFPDSLSDGGAIHVDSASPTIRNCVFAGCSTPAFGGALYLEDSAALVVGCRFESNEGTERGGAAATRGGLPRFVRCDFIGNVSNAGGALAIEPRTGHPFVGHCRFFANHAGMPFLFAGGGAIDLYGSSGAGSTRIDDSLFAGNTTNHRGQAVLSRSSPVLMTSCTLVDTSGQGEGLVALLDGVSGVEALSLLDCVVWDVFAAATPVLVLDAVGGTLEVASSDILGGRAGVEIEEGTLVWSPGNIDLDPLFVDPDGADGDPQTHFDNDWRLGAGSPCVDAAHTGLLAEDAGDVDGDGDVLEPVPFDLDLLPRRVDDPAAPDVGNGSPPHPDMGAHERQG